MTKSPPILPERKFERVLAVARADSLGVIVCSGISLLLSAAAGDGIFAFFSALALGTGAMEWHGQTRLREGFLDGLHWLTGAQGCLYTVIIGYALWRLNHFNPVEYWAQVPAPAREHLESEMRKAGLDPVAQRDELLAVMNFLVCSLLVLISTLYQGGLTFWYSRQRKAIVATLYGGEA